MLSDTYRNNKIIANHASKTLVIKSYTNKSEFNKTQLKRVNDPKVGRFKPNVNGA